MHTATVRDDGSVLLSERARSLGFRPGAVVQLSVTSAGSLLLVLDDTPPLVEGRFRPLVGGRAQLAARAGRHSE